MCYRFLPIFLILAGFSALLSPAQPSVARQWDEACLDAIRRDFPAPTVHARNLFHFSAAMYDAWAAYDSTAVGIFHNETAVAPNGDIEAARAEAMSFAAYRVLVSRYAIAVNATVTLNQFDALLTNLGYDPAITSAAGATPAEVGNRIAFDILSATLNDGSNQVGSYTDPSYSAVNPPLILANRGTTMTSPNRWQPLAFAVAQTQNGQVASQIQTFISSQWGDVDTFAIRKQSAQEVYYDPGMPPQLGGAGDLAFKNNNVDVIRFSSLLDPTAGQTINLSPGVRGNNPLGQNNGSGYGLNPITGAAYAANVVNHADYGRVAAEFWADGPRSETPPGHWNALANEVADDPAFVKQLRGTGPVLNDLEWDTKVYLALNAALHDSAVAAWDAKEAYDYVRPISSIRYMCGWGQSSDPNMPAYHPEGIPLVPGLVELITASSSLPGQRHSQLSAFVNRIAINAWAGEPADPDTQFGGTAWILGEDWLPYQRDTFITPAFAGYVSGHSTFSRAAAEVLTTLTGSRYWPGGLKEHTVPAGELEFELGPSQDVTLQWASYYDAADEAGLSRLYGGIHVAPDDGPGRIMGSKIGIQNVTRALKFYNGTILDDMELSIVNTDPDFYALRCPTVPGYYYKLQSSSTLAWINTVDVTPYTVATGNEITTLVNPSPGLQREFYRMLRLQ